jgi:hypothetical protein
MGLVGARAGVPDRKSAGAPKPTGAASGKGLEGYPKNEPPGA